MKKILLSVVVIIELFLITGCSVIQKNNKNLSNKIENDSENKQENSIQEQNENVTMDNIQKKLSGGWKSKDKLGINDNNEEVYSYLYFFDNKVMYTGYINNGPYDVKIYSLTSMYFGNQTWTYEYIDENTIVFWDNLYEKISDVSIEDFESGKIYNK